MVHIFFRIHVDSIFVLNMCQFVTVYTLGALTVTAPCSSRACTGFDRGHEDGEAIRRLMRQIANLNLNANDNFELAAA